MVLLLVNLSLFCGLCVFIFWLRVAQPFDFSWSSYFEPMRFWGSQTQSLNDFLRYPISVVDTPWHAIVLGLLMASMVAVPISVSILYRFPASLPFAGAVLIFAHMPWMAVNVVLCCMLASVKPFRLKFRFASALVGMLPFLLYLFLATRGADAGEAFASPEEKQLLALPWVITILGACVMCGAILVLSRIVNYRPGVVPPVIAVMFATPTVLFHRHVGMDEVAYRVLEREYGPQSQIFEPVQDATDQVRELLHRATRDGGELDPGHRTLLALWEGRDGARTEIKQGIFDRMTVDVMEARRAGSEACRRFIADYPTSRYIPNVLYIRGRVLDARLDERRFLGARPYRELYFDFPHIESLEHWEDLATKFTDTPMAVVAGYRAAQLQWRAGDLERALALLETSRKTAERLMATTRSAAEHWLARSAAHESLNVDVAPYRNEACQLYDLLENNRAVEPSGNAALIALAGLDPHRIGYEGALLRLCDAHRDTKLSDNLLLTWIQLENDPGRRAGLLTSFLALYRTGDAAAEAAYRLAEIELQVLGRDDESARNRGVERLETLAADGRGGYWSQAALDWLQRFPARRRDADGADS